MPKYLYTPFTQNFEEGECQDLFTRGTKSGDKGFSQNLLVKYQHFSSSSFCFGCLSQFNLLLII